jgi:hypothetical protein
MDLRIVQLEYQIGMKVTTDYVKSLILPISILLKKGMLAFRQRLYYILKVEVLRLKV